MSNFLNRLASACGPQFANCQSTMALWHELGKKTLFRHGEDALKNIGAAGIAKGIQLIKEANVIPKALMHEVAQIVHWEIARDRQCGDEYLFPLIDFAYVVPKLTQKSGSEFTCYRVMSQDDFKIDRVAGTFVLNHNNIDGDVVDGYIGSWRIDGHAHLCTFTAKEMLKAHKAYELKVLGLRGSKYLTEHIIGMRALKMLTHHNAYDKPVYQTMLMNISKYEKRCFEEKRSRRILHKNGIDAKENLPPNETKTHLLLANRKQQRQSESFS